MNRNSLFFVARWGLANLAILCFAGVAQAVHVPTNLDAPGLRTPLAHEGYLMYTINPLVGRFGEEWTGWVDVRHPSLVGANDTNLGYDRSDRRVDVRSTILTDANGSTAVPNRAQDFDYANRAYMLQSGVSVIETSVRNVTSGAGGAPAFTFPLSNAEEQAIMAAVNAAAPTVENYYAGNPAGGGNSLDSGAFGETYNPSLIAGGSNEAVFMAQTPAPRTDTFAHELFHFMGDGLAVHSPDGGDPAHSTDAHNLIAAGGVPRLIPTTLDQVGPVMSATVGGRDQLISAQVDRMFNNAGAAPWLQATDNDPAGHRVDWDFVADHAQFANDHDSAAGTAAVNFGLEGINAADNHVGVESLYWGIGPTVASPQAGKDKTGLAQFIASDFLGPFFRQVDVFSLGLRYGDSDVAAGGARSQREAALDYDLFFQLAGGGIVQGTPVNVFAGGWTNTSNADNFLARWMSPDDAVGIFIFALNTDGHDGVTQIDAIIAGFAVPEPTTALGIPFALAILGRWARRRCRQNVR